MVAVACEVGMATDIGTEEVHAALEAWARWAKTALIALGWPPVSIIGRMVEFGAVGSVAQGGIRLMEVDTICESVDRAILRLDKTEREVVMRTYLAHDAAQVTARKCGLTYGYYRHVLSRARERIGDYLDGARERGLC